MKKSLLSLLLIIFILIGGTQGSVLGYSNFSSIQKKVSEQKIQLEVRKGLMEKSIKEYNNKYNSVINSFISNRKSFFNAKSKLIKEANEKYEINDNNVRKLVKKLESITNQSEIDKCKGLIQEIKVDNEEIAKALQEDLKLYNSNIKSINAKINNINAIVKSFESGFKKESSNIKRINSAIKDLDNQINELLEQNKKKEAIPLLNTLSFKLNRLDKVYLAQTANYNNLKEKIKK